jgi:hypothetical protein
MSAAWLTYPLAFTGMRMFECGDLTTEECDYYKERWHFWYAISRYCCRTTVRN